jgi:hypothetical protein
LLLAAITTEGGPADIGIGAVIVTGYCEPIGTKEAAKEVVRTARFTVVGVRLTGDGLAYSAFLFVLRGGHRRILVDVQLKVNF